MFLRLLILLVLVIVPANAQWQANGIAVCDTIANGGIEPLSKITTDGKGGAIICWRDARNGNDYDIYAQRISSGGYALWQHNGVPVVAFNANQNFPRIWSDGNGGGFVAWEDDRAVSNTFIYAQRVDSSGQPVWPLNGTRVAEKSGLFISIASDERDGMLVGWVHGGIYDVVVQRLDGFGNRMWGDSGVQVTNRPGNVSSNDVAVVTDGSGGAIAAWAEGGRVYAQRVDSAGTVRWQENGVLLSDTTFNAFGVAISTDARGGAIVNWNYPDGSGGVQRIDELGKVLWAPSGVPLVLSGSGGARRNTADGIGGAFIGSGRNIHRLDSLGNKIWGTNGVSYYDSLGTTNSRQVHDGAQGILNFTEAFRNDGAFIIVQWIDASGSVRFGPKGTKMTPGLLTGDQFFPDATADGLGGAIVCWTDYRSRYQVVYAARIDTTGIVVGVYDEDGVIPSSFHLEQNYPNPFNPETTIEYDLPQRAFVNLKIFDLLGREVTTLVNEEQAAGRHKVRWLGIDARGQRVSSGVYFYQLVTPDRKQTKKSIFIN